MPPVKVWIVLLTIMTFLTYRQIIECTRFKNNELLLNVGLEKVVHDYFMILYPGDTFYFNNLVHKIDETEEINLKDVLHYSYNNEYITGELRVYNNDLISVYGKLYRTAFIKDNSISFASTNYYDHSFNSMVYSVKGNYSKNDEAIILINRPYLQCDELTINAFRESIVEFLHYVDFIDIMESDKINNQKAAEVVLNYLQRGYACYNILFDRVNEEALKECIKSIKTIIKKIPVSIMELITYNFIKDGFYESYNIYPIIENNIMFQCTMYDFIRLTTP